MNDNIAHNKKSLKVNFVFNFINEILVLLVPLITTPYLSRIFQEEIIGRISYSNSIITYFILFANLGFTVYGQRQIARCRDNIKEKSKTFWEIVLLRSIFTTISLGILFSIYFAIGYGEKYNIFILFLSIQVLAVYFDCNFLFQGEEDFKIISLRTIITKLICLVGIFAFVKTKDDAWLYTLFFAGATIFSSIIMIPSALKRLSRINVREINLFKHLKPTLLIFLPTLAVTLYSVLDKNMIGWLSTNPDYDNGCYDRAYKINAIALILVTVMSTIYIPRNAYEYSHNNNENYYKNIRFYANYIFLIGAPLISGFLVMSNSLSSWYLGPGFDDVPLLTKIMSVRFIVSGLNVLFNHHIFIVRGEEKIPMISNFIAAGLDIVLNLIFIPKFGALGAAIATAIAETTVCLVSGIIAIKKKYISPKYLFLCSYKKIIAAAVMFIPIYFLNEYFEYGVLSFFVIVLIGVISYFIMLLILRDRYLIDLIKKIFNILKRNNGEIKNDN